jgi:hypothetical protein
MTFFTHNIKNSFQTLCDMVEETLEATVARIYGPADELLPQHDEEVDLTTLSEEELQQLSCSVAALGSLDDKACREKLTSFRGVRKSNPTADLGKANKAINALRARITLLEREKSGTSFRARVVSTSVQLLLVSYVVAACPLSLLLCLPACLQEQQKQQQQLQQSQQHIQMQQQQQQQQQEQQQQQQAGAPQASGALHWFTSKQPVSRTGMLMELLELKH